MGYDVEIIPFVGFYDIALRRMGSRVFS